MSEVTGHDGCGCCGGTDVETPAAITNPPGLEAVAYRSGAWASFRESVVARLSTEELPALAALGARDDDDLTLALVDGFAVMADVLTFYQERIANEGFLRTATERRSVLELAALLGYSLAPGVAADAWLAFSLQETPGAPDQSPPPVTVPAGTRVLSVPGQDETAQTFETVGPIEARVEHNAIPVQTRAPQEIVLGQRDLYLAGTGHQLSPGDFLLVVGAERLNDRASDRWEMRQLQSAEPDDRRDLTRITWRDGLTKVSPATDPVGPRVEVTVFRRRAALFGYNAPDARLLSTNGTNLASVADPATGVWNNFTIQGKALDLDQPYDKLVPGSWIALASPMILNPPLVSPARVELYEAVTVAPRSRSDFGLSSKVTHVDLDTEENLELFGLRNTVVHIESEELPLAERPFCPPLYGDQMALASLATTIAPGQAVAVSGSRQHFRVRPGVSGLQLTLDDGSLTALAAGDRLALVAAPTRALAGGAVGSVAPDELLAAIEGAEPEPLSWPLIDRNGRTGLVSAGADVFALDPAADGDEIVAEVAIVADAADGVTHDRDRTYIRLASGLRHAFARETARVNANVAPATHGETVTEILGSADASRPDQQLTLKQAPLTYVRADTPSGRHSTLVVRVAETEWHERPSLYGAGPTDHAYVVKIDDDARATVTFGDGAEGARPPTGEQNLRATYRKGTGARGNLEAGQLSTLLTRPLGVNAVTNPEPASGGQDPETLATARANAPRTVLTIDRAVSLRDYEDFARGFAGIAKAQATWVPSGAFRGVFLTVAGPGAAPVEPSSLTHASLCAALCAYGDPLVRVTISSFAAATFRLRANVKVAPEAIGDDVLAAVRAGLLGVFSFEVREFGQPVSIDEVVAETHRVPGVVAVDINVLRRSDQSPSPTVRARLFAATAVATGSTVAPAELLTIDPSNLVIGVMA